MIGSLVRVTCLCAIALSMPSFAQANHERNVYVFADIGDLQLGMINVDTNELVQVDLGTLPGWPESKPQHAWTFDGFTVYMTVDATPPTPAAVVILDVASIDWAGGTADISIRRVHIIDPAGSPSSFPAVSQTVPGQPIATWTQPAFTQAHGPTFRPGGLWTYTTHWTDNRFRAFNMLTDEEAVFSPFQFGNTSRNTHGLNFNDDGFLALGTGYYYDNNKIDVYLTLPFTAYPFPLYSIELSHGGPNKPYGAFTHYTAWLDNRYAYTATMQFDRTSLTPANREVSGPSIWFMDIWTGQAKRVVGTAATADDAGIFRSPSDLNIAQNKLFVAEEDTLDGSYGDDGYISIFDLSKPRKPEFIKRLKPGVELPADFAVAHGVTVSRDGNFVFVASYATNYIIKIDAATNDVVATWGPADGLNVPHGGFNSGQFR